VSRREAGRWEITRVPGSLRERDRLIGIGEPVLERYERICFEKDKINQPPVAAFICPGHPLLDATMDLVLERYRDLLKRGAVLVDEADEGDQIRALFYLEHAVQDGRVARDGQQQIVSQRLQFVEIDGTGRTWDAGPAPYLDYRPIEDDERLLIAPALDAPWLSENAEAKIIGHAIARLIPQHVGEVRLRLLPEIDKVEREVTARLKKEINYWDHRAQDLKAQEQAGRRTRLSAAQAGARANDLADRLERRLSELHKERDISALPPLVRGGAIAVPSVLLRRAAELASTTKRFRETTAEGRGAVERLAMQAVMAAERALGHEPRDVSADRLGYDIESREVKTGRLRFIEVKGRADDADTVMVTRNEILTALNKPDAFVLAIVEVSNGFGGQPRYLRRPFQREPDFGATSVIYKLADLLGRSGSPT